MKSRILVRWPFALALWLILPALAQADPPRVNDIRPAGVQRGVATEVTFQGTGLASNPRLVAPIPVQVEPPAEPKGDAGNWVVKLTIDPAVAVGVYTIRVVTDDGISNSFLLAVGQVPQAIEVEPNNQPGEATAVPSPVVVEGRAEGNDVDHFRFPGRAGQRIVVDAACARIGSGMDPQIRLTTVSGRYVASADDSPGLLTDARLVAELPEDGDYVLEISDSRYQGTGRAVYRLTIGEIPVAGTIYPLGGRRGETVGFELAGGTLPDATQLAAATIAAPPRSVRYRPRLTSATLDIELPGPIAVSDLPEIREPVVQGSPVRVVAPVVLNGRIEPRGDEDQFTLVVVPGRKYRAAVQAAALGSSLDGLLRVLKPDGGQIEQGDDTNLEIAVEGQGAPATVISPDPSVTFAVPDGVTEVTLALRDLSSRGGSDYGYRIVVEPADPGFEVTLADPQVSIPREGSALLPVTVARRDYNGPITLTVNDPPAGLTVREGVIPEGQTVGVLSVSADSEVAQGPVVLTVVGRADGPNGPIVEEASKTVVFAVQTNLPIHFAVQNGLAAAPAQRQPIGLSTPVEVIEVAHGVGGPVPLSVDRREEAAKVELSVSALPLPAGVAVPEAKVAADADSAPIAVNVGTDAPLGRISLGLNAKGKIGEADRTFAAPAVVLEVVRPVAVELAAAEVEIKAGATAELKGNLTRKGTFREPVTIRLDGLPGGLTAEPVTVDPEMAEFTLTLAATAEAAEGAAQVQVKPAFKIGDKDYDNPPAPMSVKVIK